MSDAFTLAQALLTIPEVSGRLRVATLQILRGRDVRGGSGGVDAGTTLL